MVVSYAGYIKNIATPDLVGVEQRAQVLYEGIVYDIAWDSANDRVICLGSDGWKEVCVNGIEPEAIKMKQVLEVLNIDTQRVVLSWSQNTETTIETCLDTAIREDFLIQMEDVQEEEEEEDPSPTGSDNGSIDSDSEDPSQD
jgi:hypothetical protein